MSELAKAYLAANYHVVKTLKNSSTSLVELVTKESDSTFYVRKTIQGTAPIYTQLTKLSHPLLPKIYAVHTDGESTIVLEEFINGQNLDDYTTTKQLTEKELLSLARQITSGLILLHEYKILHRDIKPSNLILLPDGTVKLIDFDAARLSGPTGSKDTRLLGTEGFAPPEQYGFAQTDERSDIFALGKTLQQLAGRDYSGSLSPIMAKATQLAPENRYQSALEMQEALAQNKFSYYGKRIGIAIGCACVLVLGFILFNRINAPTPSTTPQANMPQDILAKATRFANPFQTKKSEQPPVKQNSPAIAPQPEDKSVLMDTPFPTPALPRKRTDSALPMDKSVGINGEPATPSQLSEVLGVTFTVNGQEISTSSSREVGARMAVKQSGNKRLLAAGQNISIQLTNNTSRPLAIRSVSLLLGNMNYTGSVGGDLSLQEQGRFPGRYMLSSGSLQRELPAHSTWSITFNPSNTQLTGGTPYLRITLQGKKFEEYSYVLRLL